jgi:hypothetical protein
MRVDEEKDLPPGENAGMRNVVFDGGFNDLQRHQAVVTWLDRSLQANMKDDDAPKTEVRMCIEQKDFVFSKRTSCSYKLTVDERQNRQVLGCGRGGTKGRRQNSGDLVLRYIFD